MLIKEVPRFETLLELSRRYPALDPRAIECCLTLRRLAADVEVAMREHFARHDLSHGRFVVLLMLDHAEGGHLTPGELAQQVGVTPATITGLLRGLERDGLVEREADAADRRVSTIRPTPRGTDHLKAMLPDHFRRLNALVGHLSAGELGELTRLLRKVARGVPALSEATPHPNP